MKQLIIILGVVLLNPTNAFAASSSPRDWALHAIETCSSPTCLSKQLASINSDTGTNSLNQESKSNFPLKKENLRLIVAEVAPQDRGNPDDRRGASR